MHASSNLPSMRTKKVGALVTTLYHRIDTGPEVSLRRYFVRNFTSADVKLRHHDAILECTRKFFIGKHRYKVPCALQDGVIARKKISDVFLQPKHIEVSLLVWYLFCVCMSLLCVVDVC
jgi:hypothetical protein